MSTEIKNNLVCEKCKQPFICNPVDISNCNCSKIHLSAQEINYVSTLYSNCVCNSCLLLLKDEFSSR